MDYLKMNEMSFLQFSAYSFAFFKVTITKRKGPLNRPIPCAQFTEQCGLPNFGWSSQMSRTEW